MIFLSEKSINKPFMADILWYVREAKYTESNEPEH